MTQANGGNNVYITSRIEKKEGKKQAESQEREGESIRNTLFVYAR